MRNRGWEAILLPRRRRPHFRVEQAISALLLHHSLQAKIHSFSRFSGHADAGEIDAWLSTVPKKATLTLVHGDPKELHDRAEQLRGQGRERVIIAKPDELIEF